MSEMGYATSNLTPIRPIDVPQRLEEDRMDLPQRWATAAAGELVGGNLYPPSDYRRSYHFATPTAQE